MWHLLFVAAFVASVAGHGRVLDPPSRASMWRAGFSTPPNYDDDGLNCGGFWHQYNVAGGKCGICGDPFDMKQPRAHELGGRWGSGQIVAHYNQGQVFTATVQISAYHRGYWEFRICTDPRNNNQDCFEKILLQLENGGTKYYPWQSGTYAVRYRLPADLVCDHCVLQWRYIAGNNWGVCPNRTEALGCGNQENFGACTDISIKRVNQNPSAPIVEVPSAPEPPLCIDPNVYQGILELIRKVAVRPRQTPTHGPTIIYQRQNNRWKQRKKKVKPRKRKKIFWNLT